MLPEAGLTLEAVVKHFAQRHMDRIAVALSPAVCFPLTGLAEELQFVLGLAGANADWLLVRGLAATEAVAFCKADA